MPMNKKNTVCCGGGGGLEHHALCSTMTENLLSLFEETGAKLMVTGCPRCHRVIEAAAPEVPVSIYRLVAESPR